MNPKRKMDENDFENLKKAKPRRTLSSYIEEERQKMLVNKESPEGIVRYVYERFHVQINNSSERLRGISDFLAQDNSAVRRNMLTSFLEQLSNIRSSATVPDEQAHAFLLHCIHSDCIPPNVALFNMRPSQSFRVPSPFPNETYVSLMAEIVSLLRYWNLDLYQKCMNNYDLMRREHPEFWDNVIMKALPPAMLEHCTSSNIIADFFHSMCKEFNTMNLLVRIKSSYMQFFLMNMAAVNRIEHSTIVRPWESTKPDLVKRAIIEGQPTNLRLLLQYFRPNDLWSCPTRLFIRVPLSDWMMQNPSNNNISSLTSGYCRELTLFNLLRIATYVAESPVPKSVLADCIQLLWRASETPYATLEKIKNASETMKFETNSILIRGSRNSLLAAYPKDCLMENQPRSLMHLSRCKIRQNIISAVYVPFLPVPNRLIEYINLEW